MFSLWGAAQLQRKSNQKMAGLVFHKLGTSDWIQNWPSLSQQMDFKLKVALLHDNTEPEIMKFNIIYHYLLALVAKYYNVKICKYIIKNIVDLSENKFTYK